MCYSLPRFATAYPHVLQPDHAITLVLQPGHVITLVLQPGHVITLVLQPAPPPPSAPAPSPPALSPLGWHQSQGATAWQRNHHGTRTLLHRPAAAQGSRRPAAVWHGGHGQVGGWTRL